MESTTGYAVLGAEVLETGPDGAPRYRLRAARVDQDPRTTAVLLQEIAMQIETDAVGGWQIEAARGSIPAGARQVSLSGAVELRSERDPQGTLRIRSDTLDYEIDTQRASAAGAIAMDFQGHQLTGVGLEADLVRRQIKLKSSIHGEFTR